MKHDEEWLARNGRIGDGDKYADADCLDKIRRYAEHLDSRAGGSIKPTARELLEALAHTARERDSFVGLHVDSDGDFVVDIDGSRIVDHCGKVGEVLASIMMCSCEPPTAEQVQYMISWGGEHGEP